MVPLKNTSSLLTQTLFIICAFSGWRLTKALKYNSFRELIFSSTVAYIWRFVMIHSNGGKIRALLAAAVFSVLFSSCMTAGGYINNRLPDKKKFGPPDTHTLIFGYMDIEGISEVERKIAPGIGIHDFEIFAQVNPEKEAFFAMPLYFKPNIFCFQPVESGVLLRLLKSYYTTLIILFGRPVTVTYHLDSFFGAPDASSLQYTAAKPGLYYAGSYTRSKDRYTREDTRNELEALKIIQPYFKRTAWQPVIEERIKELEK